MKKKFSIPNKGFTLVEMLVAVGLFTVITFLSLGALLSVYDAHKKAKASKTVVDNLNMSLENLTRNIRFGTNYFCGVSSNINATNDCSEGGSSISVTFEGGRIVYRLNGTAIQKSENGGATYSDITSSDTVIEHLKFYVFGSSPSPDLEQPYAVAVIRGYVGSKPGLKSSFSIETLMSQRMLDI